MKRILAVAAVVALLSGCGEKNPYSGNEPFGFKWGQHASSIENSGLPILRTGNDSGIKVIWLTSAPDDALGIDKYILYLSKEFGLLTLEARSNEFKITEPSELDAIYNVYSYVGSKVIELDQNKSKDKNLLGDKEAYIKQCIEGNDCSKFNIAVKDGDININLTTQNSSSKLSWVSITYSQ
ncbi:TPA: hypothetical protein ACS70L_002878 [Providencia alcalifaciens]